MSWRHIIAVRGLYHALKGRAYHAARGVALSPQQHEIFWCNDAHPRSNYVISDETMDTTHKKSFEVTKETHIHQWLVVGDGDLSYSANLAKSLLQQHASSSSNNIKVQLIASVLENSDAHKRIYRCSDANIQSLIETTNLPPKFEIDATSLEDHFELNSLHRIIFNFPHWIGKSNNRYNRQLLQDFFKSATRVLAQSPASEIHITLCHRQGGADATIMSEWKQSWMAHSIAAEHGLLLRRLQPFEINYNLSSHRGVDRPFHVGESPLTYVFGWPIEGKAIPEMLQIAYRFELRMLLIPENLSRSGFTTDQIKYGDIIPKLAQELLPHGIACQLPMRSLIPTATDTADQRWPLLVFLVIYSGEQIPVSRSCANMYRICLETAVEERLGTGSLLRKGDRMVSFPFPYHLLSTLVEERNNEQCNSRNIVDS